MNDWIDAEEHAERAHRHIQVGQWDRALEELEQALRLVPDQSEWLGSLAQALDALERYDEAAAVYERLVRVRGESVDTLLRLGVDLIRSGKCQRAIATLARAAEIDPACEAAYCHRIAAYIQIGDHENAETMFYLARQIVDECPVCFDYIAQSLVMRGLYERAAWCWQQALRLDPQMTGVASSLARVYWRLDQLELACHYLQHELRENPDDTDALLTLGAVLWEQDKPAEAGERFRRALDLDPTLHEAHLYLGELALHVGHLDGAEARFERAHQINPDQPGACTGLAQVALRRGDREAARRHLRAELVRPRHTLMQAVTLARLLIEVECPQDVIELLDPVLADATTSDAGDASLVADAYLCRGAALMMAGEVFDGILDTKQALSLEPDNGVSLHNLALAYMETGRLTRAAYWLRRAEQVLPHEPAIQRTRARLRRRWALARLRRLLHR